MEVLEHGNVIWLYGEGNKPPLAYRNLMKRVAERNRRQQFVIRWMKCGRGCAHGRAFNFVSAGTRALVEARTKRPLSPFAQYIRLYFEPNPHFNSVVLLHEAAHHIANLGHRHDDFFYRALLKEAKAEGLLRAVIVYQGGAARRVAREMRAAGLLTTDNKSGTFVRTAAGGKHG